MDILSSDRFIVGRGEALLFKNAIHSGMNEYPFFRYHLDVPNGVQRGEYMIHLNEYITEIIAFDQEGEFSLRMSEFDLVRKSVIRVWNVTVIVCPGIVDDD